MPGWPWSKRARRCPSRRHLLQQPVPVLRKACHEFRSLRRVSSHPPSSALRLRRSEHGQGEGSGRRGGYYRPRHGQSRQPDAAAHRRQADRDGAGPSRPSLLRQQGHPWAAPGSGCLLRAPLRRRPEPGNRSRRHPGLQGRSGESGLGDHQPGRHHPGAEPVLSDPPVRLHHRRRGGAQYPRHPGRGHAARARPCGAALGAETHRIDRQLSF